MISVLLADDHTIVRKGLASLLRSETDIKVIGEAENGRQAVSCALELSPNVLVMDIGMPILNGLEAARQILRSVKGCRIIILSAYSDDASIEKVIAVGASGYLVKHTASDELPAAIRKVHAGETHFSPIISQRVRHLRCNGSTRATLGPGLTLREMEVLQLIAEGNPNKITADILCVSIKTVEKHRQNIMRKTGIHDVSSLTRYAISEGIIESGFPPAIP